MDQNAALKRAEQVLAEVTEAFDSELIVASNDAAGNPVEANIEMLRDKIKASRLEKLMARQLESELSINEISFEPSFDDDFLDQAIPTEPVSSNLQNHLRQTPAPMEREPSSVTRSRFHANRSDCESLVTDIRDHAETLHSLAGRSDSLISYLNRIEEEFRNMDSMELELREKSRELERSTTRMNEGQSLIDKQRKQIQLLETMRNTANENYEDARRELDDIQAENERLTKRVNESAALLSRLERENMTFSEKFDMARMELEKAGTTIKSLRRQGEEHDRSVSQLRAELSETTAQNEQALNELSALQIRYNELNKKSLESQGQHYTKISQLEEAIREMKSLLDRRTREKTELQTELDAANNLLVLHEEMISALSPQRRA
ncbi:MAG: hypothetical protein AAFN43_11305 [Pseudomonadota bacterium]